MSAITSGETGFIELPITRLVSGTSRFRVIVPAAIVRRNRLFVRSHLSMRDLTRLGQDLIRSLGELGGIEPGIDKSSPYLLIIDVEPEDKTFVDAGLRRPISRLPWEVGLIIQAVINRYDAL